MLCLDSQTLLSLILHPTNSSTCTTIFKVYYKSNVALMRVIKTENSIVNQY